MFRLNSVNSFTVVKFTEAFLVGIDSLAIWHADNELSVDVGREA